MIRTFARRLAVLMLGTLILTVQPACSTVEGAGKDIEKAGDAIQDAAD